MNYKFSISLIFLIIWSSWTHSILAISSSDIQQTSPFVTTWKTDNSGNSGPNQILIPTRANANVPYNYDVYWEEIGNGSNSGTIAGVTGDLTITFPNAGAYRVEIQGQFPAILFSNQGDKDKLLTIEQWGDIEWETMGQAFNGCSNLVINASDVPDFDNLTNLTAMFKNASSVNMGLENWDLTNVRFTNEMFYNAVSFNGDISGWDVGNVEQMTSMFRLASSFNRDISSWDVSNVTNFGAMFRDASSFNQPLNSWDVSSATNMTQMFRWATSFNQDLNSWDVSSVRSMDSMFSNAELFNGEVGNWDMRAVEGITGMFQNAESFNQPIGDWQLESLERGSSVFFGATSFNQDISQWDVSSLSTMVNMFRNATSFNQNISAWDVSSVENMGAMFQGATSFNQPLDNWNTENVTNMASIFQDAASFNQDLNNWDVSNVTSLKSAFFRATVFDGDISSWNTVSLLDARDMFEQARAFNQNIGDWDVSSVTTMDDMFKGANAFNQNLGDWDVGQVTSMNIMFSTTSMSRDNYDSTLIGWNSLPGLQPNVTLVAAPLKYCLAESERQNIINTYNWSILDDVLDCDLAFVSANNVEVEENSTDVFYTAQVEGNTGGVAFSLGSSLDEGNILIDPVSGEMWFASPPDFENPTDANGDNVYEVVVIASDDASTVSIVVNITVIDIQEDSPFVTTWKTDNNGSSSDNQITIRINPASQYDYNYAVTWREVGNSSNTGSVSNLSDDVTITFPNPGTYRVEISGDFPAIQFNNEGDRLKILGIEQWGDIEWEAFHRAFWGCENLEINASDAPDLSQVPTLTQSFQGCSNLNASLNHWDVSSIVNMRATFSDAVSFNQPLDNWDVSSVLVFNNMFEGAFDFNQNLNSWDVSEAVSISNMFTDARSYNQPMDNWDVSNVANMRALFMNAWAFNQDIGNWDVSNVTTMRNMFWNAQNFNQAIGNWDVSSVTEMSNMFRSCFQFNHDISGWDVSNVTVMSGMFTQAADFNQNISSWDVSNVFSMSNMFQSASRFNQDIGSWDVQSVTRMDRMFQTANMFNQDLSSWDVGSVTRMDAMFDRARDFDQNIGGWNVTNVSRMENMLDQSGLSVVNYDSTLIGWGSQTVLFDVELGAEGLFYTTFGKTGRDVLTDDFNWTIIGDSLLASSETDMISFVLSEQIASATIDALNHTIDIEVVCDTDLSALVPDIVISEGASVSPASGIAQDFSSSVIYTVTAEDGVTVQAWTVTVHVSDGIEISIDPLPVVEAEICATSTANVIVGYGNSESVQLSTSLSGGTNGSYTYEWSPTANLTDPTIADPIFTADPTLSGFQTYSFEVTVMDDQGCSATDAVNVDVVNVLATSNGNSNGNSNKVVICHKGKKTIEVSANAVKAHLANGSCLGSCDASNARNQDNESRSDFQSETVTSFVIYPNPSRGETKVKFQTGSNSVSIRVYEISGLLVEEIQSNSSNDEIVIGQNLDAGVYLVKVSDGNRSMIRRMVIE